MLTWLQNEAKTHLFYIILIVMGVVCFRVWLSEHDARVQADNAVKQSEVRIATLQQQITTTNQQAAAKVQTVVKIVHDATTPSAVVAAVPLLTNAPLNTRVAPDGAGVEVDSQPFVELLGQCKADSINLGACQQNYQTCQDIIKEKDVQIAALKKKPRFIKRVLGVAKAVGVGVGIGLFLGGKL